jgi:hypothetical protein
MLEERAVPSGGPGHIAASSGSGHDGKLASPPALVAPLPTVQPAIIQSTSQSGGQLLPGSGKLPKGLVLDDVITLSSSDGGTLTLEIFSKYPLPPGVGPALANDLLSVNPSTLAIPTSQSSLGMVPLYVTYSGVLPSNFPTSPIQVAAVDPTTGATIIYAVTLVPANGQVGVSNPPTF